MADDNKKNDKEIEKETFNLTRESKKGRMTSPFKATSIPIMASFGVVCVCATLFVNTIVDSVSGYIDDQKYAYDSDYDSYSEQIEDIISVDLETSLEDDLNSLQNMRELIDEYERNESLIIKADALSALENQKDLIEKTSLNIAKKWCANEWGGNSSDYKIIPEGSNLPGWVVTNSQTGTHELPHGQIYDLLDSIGNLQGYGSEMIEETPESSNKFVSTCNAVIRCSGKVAADISEAKSK